MRHSPYMPRIRILIYLFLITAVLLLSLLAARHLIARVIAYELKNSLCSETRVLGHALSFQRYTLEMHCESSSLTARNFLMSIDYAFGPGSMLPVVRAIVHRGELELHTPAPQAGSSTSLLSLSRDLHAVLTNKSIARLSVESLSLSSDLFQSPLMISGFYEPPSLSITTDRGSSLAVSSSDAGLILWGELLAADVHATLPHASIFAAARLAFEGEGSFSEDAFRARVSLSAPALMSTPAQAIIVAQENGKAQVSLEPYAIDLQSFLHNFRDFIPQTRVDSGSCTVQGDFSTPDLAASVRCREVSGESFGVKINKLSSDGQLSYRDELAVSPLTFSAEEIRYGIAMSRFRSSIALDPGLRTATITTLGADVFDGSLSLSPLSLPLTPSAQSALLHVEEINLQKVLALYASQHVTGTGIVSGSLPLSVGLSGITISSGELRSVGGGTLHVSDLSMLPEQAQGALKDFHYDSLIARVDYAVDGTLSLAVSLFGRNPNFRGGAPVNLHVTISENIPQLLRSLRLLQNEGVQELVD